jgi:para-aminobenzoate synthetase component 1
MFNQNEVKSIKISESFCTNVFQFSRQFSHVAWLDSKREDASNRKLGESDLLIALGKKSELVIKETNGGDGSAFQKLKMYFDESKWAFGHFSYDLKNDVEEGLTSKNTDGLHFPEMNFFEPEILIKINKGVAEINADNEKVIALVEGLNDVSRNQDEANDLLPNLLLKTKLSKSEYIDKIEAIKKRIHRGDVYEVNFCCEFYAENTEVDPFALYQALVDYSPTPFSSFVKTNEHFVVCASPERFMKKTGHKLISQPIKGTIKRGGTSEEDEELKEKLLSSPKERSENVMIVDLVRNDLSQIAEDGSVQVDELFGIYTFPQVHQMISTVSCNLKKEVHPIDAIANCFPMGSMTGAPKIKSMQIIEEMETTKRGVYSGSVGYFTPGGDFDFNVVIRSLLYNAKLKYLSFSAGGAITANSDAELEYEEVLLKAKAVFEVLSGSRS